MNHGNRHQGLKFLATIVRPPGDGLAAPIVRDRGANSQSGR